MFGKPEKMNTVTNIICCLITVACCVFIWYHVNNRPIIREVVKEQKIINLDVCGSTKMYKRMVDISAYSPRECETDSTPFETASLRRVKEGTVAVSRDIFELVGKEFGGIIVIPSLDEVYIIDDLMNKRYPLRIDKFMFSTSDALKHGVLTEVEIIIIPGINIYKL